MVLGLDEHVESKNLIYGSRNCMYGNSILWGLGSSARAPVSSTALYAITNGCHSLMFNIGD